MAMPPDGGSPWLHHDDVWIASDPGGTFVELTVQVSGRVARWSMPCLDRPYDSFFVLGFSRLDDAGEGVLVERYGTDGITQTPWTATTPVQDLLPDGYREVLPRHPVLGPPEGATAIAHLRMSAAGAIELLDAQGRVRSAVWRREGPTAEAASFGPAIPLCGGRLCAVLLQHPGTRVSQRQSSLP